MPCLFYVSYTDRWIPPSATWKAPLHWGRSKRIFKYQKSWDSSRLRFCYHFHLAVKRKATCWHWGENGLGILRLSRKVRLKWWNEVWCRVSSFDVSATFGKIWKELGKIGMKLGIVSLQTGHQWLLVLARDSVRWTDEHEWGKWWGRMDMF